MSFDSVLAGLALASSIGLCQTALLQGQSLTPSPKIEVRSLSPADSDTELQVICLFRSSPRNPLSGALTLTDNALHGLLTEARSKGFFGGELGETLLIDPPTGALKARHLLLIGLGDSATFTPERMRFVGKIFAIEADHLHVQNPFFAPTVLDGGVKRYTTGQVSEQVVLGILDAVKAENWLAEQHAAPTVSVQTVTYLAGKEYAAVTQSGVDKATAEAK